MIYPGTISLSTAHLTHLAEHLRAHRAAIGSRWRKLTAGQQALLALAHLRNGDTYARLAAGFGVGVATVWRYVREAVDLLAAFAPSLTAALWRLASNGHRLGILDGTVVRIDRLSGDLDRLYYSGKHHHHGVNLQGLIDPRRGDLVWISDGLPGSTHDLTAARTHDIIRSAARADVELLADKGFQGAGGTVTSPHKGRKLTKDQKTHNRMVNSVRGPGERGFAVLKTWRIFTKVRCCPQRVGPLAKAVLTLELGPES
ncbi:transposase family protein [Phytohabitans suffuscus]|uniref:IS5 family transposase n=1 Tax=Phytohabitans suffuscus TaxID=624315 RepID=A0A6F8YBS2_9ACTN|nr:transposase family protein [Phytohabitans suffuscus]BCB83517.1 IS5 family transposase [Phytohabitans suffuscus]